MQDPYLDQVASEIQQWEARGPRLFPQLLSIAARPLHEVASFLVPEDVRRELAQVLERPLSQLQQLGARLSDAQGIQSSVAMLTREGFSLFDARDRVARRAWLQGVALAGAEGALLGFVGWPGLLIDAPALYTLTLKTLADISTVYGFDLTDPAEQHFLLTQMAHALGAGVEERLGSVLELKALEQGLLRDGSRLLGQRVAQRTATMALTQRVAEASTADLLQRKALQSLPFVGALLGGSLNAMFVNGLAETAFMAYRQRRLHELTS